MRTIQAQPGWCAITAKPDKNNPIGFQVAKYPLVGWAISGKQVDPVSPVGVFEQGFRAAIDPTEQVFALGQKFPSLDAWLEHIRTEYAACF